MSTAAAMVVVGLEVLPWWAAVQTIAFASLPVADWLLGNLPSRGYVFAKALGLMVVGYILWMTATFGLLVNSAATISLLTLALGVFAWSKLAPRRPSLLALWHDRRGLVIGSELVFLLGLFGWALVRAYEPDILGTEKPMEFAFLNALLRSDRYPPADPWLSGFSISYYYFGYLIVSMLARVTGTLPGVAFNLSLALLFALTATGAFGLVYDLVAASLPRDQALRERGPIIAGLISAYLLVILGNLEALVEIADVRGLLSEQTWRWLQIKDLPSPAQVAASPSWVPVDWMWWFRASRVIGQFDFSSGQSTDYTINEFPFFSFVLGDVHPHVLALPFVLLALAVALNLLLSEEPLGLAWVRSYPLRLLAMGVVFGGLAFINSWDLPTYLFVLVAVAAMQRLLLRRERLEQVAVEVLAFGGSVLLASLVLYLPFYVAFRSQTSGIGIVTQRSQLHQFLIFWGPLLFLAGSGALWHILRLRSRVSGTELLVLGLAVLAVGLLGIAGSGTLALCLGLLLLLGSCLYLSLREHVAARELAAGKDVSSEASWLPQGALRPRLFVLLLLGSAALLLAGCEVLFVRDLFGNRMNTVFKLYYQAWVLLSVGGGYVLYYLAFRSRPSARSVGAPMGKAAWGLLALALLIGGSVYPVAAAASRLHPGNTPVLDGTADLRASAAAEYAAIDWLLANAPQEAVILEAAGGSYSAFARISENTGLPTVVGWDFHEVQWRGNADEAMRRKADVETIYTTSDVKRAEALLERYRVEFVYVGQLEQQAYGKAGRAALEKFGSFMDLVYSNPTVRIYRVHRPAEAAR